MGVKGVNLVKVVTAPHELILPVVGDDVHLLEAGKVDLVQSDVYPLPLVLVELSWGAIVFDGSDFLREFRCRQRCRFSVSQHFDGCLTTLGLKDVENF